MNTLTLSKTYNLNVVSSCLVFLVSNFHFWGGKFEPYSSYFLVMSRDVRLQKKNFHGNVFLTLLNSRRVSSKFNEISRCLTSVLLAAEIQRIVNQLGTAQDTNELRQQLRQKQQHVNNLAKETDKYMKQFGTLPSSADQRQRKILKERLVEEFSSALNNFQMVQRQAAQKEKEFGGLHDDGYQEENISSFESKNRSEAQVQEDAITEEDLMLIKERETAIRQLESDIVNINEIFKDLGMMIHEQGETIDSIEANVENAEVHVQSANEQLARAADYQSRSRKKIFILIVVLVIVAVIIGVIIWASVKS
ncbi:STX7 protein, partial [Polypterus senegalus]|nr:STX7 protein [Polypterus senegalus]